MFFLNAINWQMQYLRELFLQITEGGGDVIVDAALSLDLGHESVENVGVVGRVRWRANKVVEDECVFVFTIKALDPLDEEGRLAATRFRGDDEWCVRRAQVLVELLTVPIHPDEETWLAEHKGLVLGKLAVLDGLECERGPVLGDGRARAGECPRAQIGKDVQPELGHELVAHEIRGESQVGQCAYARARSARNTGASSVGTAAAAQLGYPRVGAAVDILLLGCPGLLARRHDILARN